MKAALFGLLFLIAMIALFANWNAKNKKKIQKHIENGDIDPAILNGSGPNPSSDLRETFRQLANN